MGQVLSERAVRQQFSVPEAVRDILFPTDLEPRARAAFQHAVMIAERFKAALTIFHVVEGPDADAPWSAPQETARRRAAEARDRLALDTAPLAISSRVVVGRAADARAAVGARLASEPADLVVLPTHGREGLMSLHPRSVSDLVLAQARCPVLCVREPEHGGPVPYRRVLVPTDLSETSRRALPFATLLASAFGAELIGLHVAPHPSVASLSGIPQIVDDRVPTEAAVAAFFAPDTDEVRLRPLVRAGSPWDTILDTARREHADLVVLSTHGHDSLVDRVLGSHADRVVRESPCPVVVL